MEKYVLDNTAEKVNEAVKNALKFNFSHTREEIDAVVEKILNYKENIIDCDYDYDYDTFDVTTPKDIIDEFFEEIINGENVHVRFKYNINGSVGFSYANIVASIFEDFALYPEDYPIGSKIVQFYWPWFDVCVYLTNVDVEEWVATDNWFFEYYF